MSISFGSSVRVSHTWAEFYSIAQTKSLLIQYVDDGPTTEVFAFDGPVIHTCTVWNSVVPNIAGYTQEQNDAILEDMQTKCSSANQPLEVRSKDGRQTVRVSTANRSTAFKLRVFSFYTGRGQASVHNVNPVTDLDYGDVTLTMHGADGAVVTDGSLAVKTVCDFEPHYNYEIIGGYLDVPSSIVGGTTDEWFMSSIGVPDYPPEMFGSVDYISEVNLEAISQKRFESDGRAISFLPYNYGGAPHTNRLRFITRHPVGAQVRFQLYIEHFV